MSSITYKGFRFTVPSNDHLPPHVDVVKGRGRFKIYIALGEGMPEPGKSFDMSYSDWTRALELCCEHHGELVTLWRSVHGDKEIR
jgi:hypothetical protein